MCRTSYFLPIYDFLEARRISGNFKTFRFCRRLRGIFALRTGETIDAQFPVFTVE